MRLLIETLENHITDEKGIDNIHVGPYSFFFSGEIQKQKHPYETGVTHMGYSESYILTEYTIISLKLEGVYNDTNQQVLCQVPCNEIKTILNERKMTS